MKWLAFMVIIAGCNSSTKMTKSNKTENFSPDFSGPPTMVYKTKADYSKNVPVILSDDKTVIISYPAPTDLKPGGTLATPTLLSNGYLLDNRGINANVAFLKITYSEYSKLSESPDIQILKSLIIDSDPLLELCNCGNRYSFKNPQTDIDKLITSGKLRTDCKVLK